MVSRKTVGERVPGDDIKGENMSQETHDSIMTAIQTYSEENGKFVDKGVKASATRARKALAELSKLIKARRKEIQEVKNAAKTAA